MNFEAGGLRLLVKDDGVGFEVADRPTRPVTDSLGLPGMTERAHLIGSRLVIHSEPGPEPPSTSGCRQRFSMRD